MAIHMYELQLLEAYLSKKEHVTNEKLQQELERIEKELLQFIYNNQPLEKTRVYVRQHVQGLLRLLTLERETGDEQCVLRPILEKLLLFIEKHSEPYWSYDLPVAEFQKEFIGSMIEAALPVVKSKIQPLHLPDPFNIIFFQDVQNLMSMDSINYGQMYMIKSIFEVLLQLQSELSESDETIRLHAVRKLKDVLCRYNFNSVSLYEYGTMQIEREQEMAKEKSTADQIFQLLRLQQYYDSTKVQIGYSFQSHRSPLTVMLSDYIQDIIDVKRSEFILQKATENDASQDSKPLKTSLSVEKLGFFVRLFLDTYVFRSNNWRGISRFMGAFVGTVGKSSKESSSDSVYNNMYSPSLKTIMGVIEILERMMKRAVIWKNAMKATGKPPEKVD